MVRVLRLACGAAVSAAALLLGDAGGESSSSRNSKGIWDCNWDRRDPVFLENERKQKGLPPPVPRNDHIQPGTRHLLLVRHAEYDLNGLSDESRALTDKGRQQAKLTAMRLANLGFHYDAIIHSSMKRAVETAQIIQTKIPGPELQSSDLLREGMPYRPEPINHWRPEMKYFTDGARIEAAFRECFHRAEDYQNGDTYVIIVCHANVIRYFVCRALQFPPEGWLRMSLNHGSITWISIRPNGRVSLKALGDSGFMPPDLLTH